MSKRCLPILLLKKQGSAKTFGLRRPHHLHYSDSVSTTIPPSANPLPSLPAALPSSDGGAALAAALGSGTTPGATPGAGTTSALTPPATPAATATAQVAATTATTAAAATSPIVAAVQAALADTVNLSPQAQQAVKFEAFQQLVASLVQHIDPEATPLPARWPAGGVTPQLQALVSHLLQQATANQPLPQQLVSVQSWPTVLSQAVLQHAGDGSVPPAANPQPAGAAGAVQPPASPLPALQNWLVQQGSVLASDGERAFTLTLRVPVAWAQAHAALGSALPSGSGASGVGLPLGSLQLPFAGSVQQLANGHLGLVMQPQAVPGSAAAMAAQALRTSAVLQLEFQPLPAAVAQSQATSVYLPAQMLPQDMQALLQARPTDPWLLMAQAQAQGQFPKQPKERGAQDGLCQRAGCQYQGRAACAQPFCAEMNYLWSVDRAQRRS